MKNLLKNWFRLFVILLVLLATTQSALAISGACSYHGGVDCSRGRQLNGKVYCNDGWTESMAYYDFMVMCKNQRYSCTLVEWGTLAEKYDINNRFFQLQDIVDKMGAIATNAGDISKSVDYQTFYSLQAQYNTLNDQQNLATSIAERECEVLGEARAVQRENEKTQLDFYSDQLKAEQEKIAQLEAEKRAITENYLKALNDLNSQSTCSANSTQVGNQCVCNKGFVVGASGEGCITGQSYCEIKFGYNSTFNADTKTCSCNPGYEFRDNYCNEVPKIVAPIPATIPPPVNKSEKEVQTPKPTQVSATSVAQLTTEQNTMTNLEKLAKETSSSLEKGQQTVVSPTQNIANNEAPQKQAGFFSKIFGSIKSFFSRIFK